MRTALIVGVLVLLSASPGLGADPQVQTKFDAFCLGWMQKLEARERDNRAAIKWQNGPSGSSGEFTGYSKEHECKLKEQPDPKAVPIGTIKYMELRYQQNGATPADAAKAEPTVI